MGYTLKQITLFYRACHKTDNLHLHSLMHIMIVAERGKKTDIDKMAKLLEKDG